MGEEKEQRQGPTTFRGSDTRDLCSGEGSEAFSYVGGRSIRRRVKRIGDEGRVLKRGGLRLPKRRHYKKKGRQRISSAPRDHRREGRRRSSERRDILDPRLRPKEAWGSSPKAFLWRRGPAEQERHEPKSRFRMGRGIQNLQNM